MAAAQLVEEELAWKAEESRQRQRLDKAEREYKAEKKWREVEKAKGKKRKADEEEELYEESVKEKER